MKKNSTGYNIQTSLEFKTDKQTKGKQRFTFAVIFAVGLVMLTAVCLLLLMREYDYDIDNIIGRRTEPSSSMQTVPPEAEPVEGKANFLIACCDNDCKKLHHAAIVRIDAGDCTAKVYTVDVFRKTKNGESLSTLFSRNAGSMLMLKSAVQELTGVETDRYIKATENSFKELVKLFGGIEFEVEKRVKYSCDGVGYIIEKGAQTLTADMSCKYMYYLSQQNGNDPETMSRLLCAMLSQYVTQNNLKSADSLYKKLTNLLDTDISAFDYSNSRQALEFFVSGFGGDRCTVTESLDAFFD